MMTRIEAAAKALYERAMAPSRLELTPAHMTALMREVAPPYADPKIAADMPTLAFLQTIYGRLEVHLATESAVCWRRSKIGRYEVVPWTREPIPA